MVKVIHWELSKKLYYHRTYKWYNHKPEAALENKTHKIFYDFVIQMDHSTQARRPDPVFINKKKRTCYIVDVTVPTDF